MDTITKNIIFATLTNKKNCPNRGGHLTIR